MSPAMTDTNKYWECSPLAEEAREAGDIFRFEDNVDEAAITDLYGMNYAESEQVFAW